MMGVATAAGGNVTWNSHEIHKLIEFVRQKDCLYASECPDYNNRDVVWGYWSEIGKILNKPAVACRDKWTNLRGVYRRLVMSSPYQRLPVRNKTRKTWSWESYMAFLKPHLHHRKSTMREAGAQSFSMVEVEAQQAQQTQHSQQTTPGYLQGLQPGMHRADPDAHRYDAEDEYMGHHQHHQHHHQVNVVSDVDADDDTTFDSSSPTDAVLVDGNVTNEGGGPGGVGPGGGGGKHYATSLGPGGLTAGPVKTEAVDDFFRYLQTPAAPLTKSGAKASNGGNKSSDEGSSSNVGLTMDPDELFFKSIIPDVKMLNPRDKGAFKLRVLQMLQTMLYPKSELDEIVNEVVD